MGNANETSSSPRDFFDLYVVANFPEKESKKYETLDEKSICGSYRFSNIVSCRYIHKSGIFISFFRKPQRRNPLPRPHKPGGKAPQPTIGRPRIGSSRYSAMGWLAPLQG